MVDQLRWVWQQPDWPAWRWDAAGLSADLALARRAQGEALGRTQLLSPNLDVAAQAEILLAEGLATSAIEGEQLDVQALRRSIARRLGVTLETATPPAPAKTRSKSSGRLRMRPTGSRIHARALNLAGRPVSDGARVFTRYAWTAART